MPELLEPGTFLSRTADQPSIRPPARGVLLRPWTRTDGTRVRSAVADEQIQRWNLLHIDTIADAGDWVDRWAMRWRERTGASWAVVSCSRPDVVLGQVAFRSLYPADGLAEISSWVVPGVRRRHVTRLGPQSADSGGGASVTCGFLLGGTH